VFGLRGGAVEARAINLAGRTTCLGGPSSNKMRAAILAVRIVLDPRERHDFVKLGDLSDNVRIKRGGPFMHLKAYSIDEEELRTGSANFSTSGENAQDNDLIVIRDPGAAARFDVHFERMWNAAQPMDEFEPAIKALEPK
jgi:phosphatidylserine/phosphatidylglycerophosphate/cardiolipin synthase-like enzyme